MVQEIITYIILLVTFGVVGFRLVRFVFSFGKKRLNQASAGKCGSCCTGCAAKDLNGNPECSTGPARAGIEL